MEDSNYKEVRFDKYCHRCNHWNGGAEVNAKVGLPYPACAECLEEFYREGTEKPLRYEKARFATKE